MIIMSYIRSFLLANSNNLRKIIDSVIWLSHNRMDRIMFIWFWTVFPCDYCYETRYPTPRALNPIFWIQMNSWTFYTFRNRFNPIFHHYLIRIQLESIKLETILNKIAIKCNCNDFHVSILKLTPILGVEYRPHEIPILMSHTQTHRHTDTKTKWTIHFNECQQQRLTWSKQTKCMRRQWMYRWFWAEQWMVEWGTTQ